MNGYFFSIKIEIDLTIPNPIEFAEYLVKTYLRAYGFTTLKQITHLKRGEILRKNVNEILASMLAEGSIQKINIDGMPSVFVQSNLMEKAFQKNNSIVQLLSPFDNSIIHRDRTKQFFDFDFRLECYTPKEKRQYGYFCLPILLGNTFLGRVDCKAHRKEKLFEIIHLHVENQNINFEFWVESFVESIRNFAIFNGCESLKLTRVSPSELTDVLKRAL